MKVDPRDLFEAERGDPLSITKINRGCGKDPFIHGYFTAALQLAEAIRDNRSPPDTVIFPVVFMFRHALELTFKELLYGFVYEVEREHREIGGHQLKPLWEELQPFFRDYSYHGENSEGYWAAREWMPILVEVLHEMDPDGQHARYEITNSVFRKGIPTKPTMARYPSINLRVLAALISDAFDWAINVLADRDQTLDYVSHRRDELGLGYRREGLLTDPSKKTSPQK